VITPREREIAVVWLDLCAGVDSRAEPAGRRELEVLKHEHSARPSKKARSNDPRAARLRAELRRGP